MWNQRWIQRCPSACLQSKFVLPSFWLEEQGWDLQEIPMPPGASCRQCWLRTSLLSPFSPRICFLKSWGAKKLLGDPKAGGPNHGHCTVPLCIMQWRWRSCVGSALEPLEFNSLEENKTNSSKSRAELWVNKEGLGWWTRGTEMPVLSPLSQAKHFGGRIHRLARGSNEWRMLV